MSFDPVPWFVGGGAEHSPDVARTLAFAATGGAQAVVEPGDLKVTPMPAPTGQVRIYPGSASIRNAYPGVSKQSYMVRSTSVTDLPITPTGSSGGRSDLVVVRVDDPQFGGSMPVSVENGPYVRAQIIENVPAGSTTVPASVQYPAIPLARIDLPANTATVTGNLITDLRELANPRRERNTYIGQPNAGESFTDSTSTTMAQFPTFAPQVKVPSWATHYKIIVHFASLATFPTDGWGFLEPRLGATAGPVMGWDIANAPLHSRIALLTAMEGPVGNMAGTTQTLTTWAKRDGGTGYLRSMVGTTVIFDVEFLERPL